MLNNDSEQDNNDLDSSKLDIPDELKQEGKLNMLNSEENLDPHSLEMPEELQKEAGFSLL